MPLYEYFCEDCQKEFTLLQSADANKAETKCSGCGSQKTQHKFSSFAPKIVGKPLADLQKPATINDFPNKDFLKLRPPRLRSEL